MYKPLSIGKLNKRITFLKKEIGYDEMGQEIQEDFKPFKTVWATIKSLRGGEYWEAQKVRPEQTYKVTTRYHKGITTDMIIQYKDKRLEIETINNVEENNYMLEMQCVEYIETE